jgi:hypothetical protein
VTTLESLPWIGFLKSNRSVQTIVHAETMPGARKKAASALRTREENVAVWVVAEGEEVEAAKARVAGGAA